MKNLFTAPNKNRSRTQYAFSSAKTPSRSSVRITYRITIAAAILTGLAGCWQEALPAEEEPARSAPHPSHELFECSISVIYDSFPIESCDLFLFDSLGRPAACCDSTACTRHLPAGPYTAVAFVNAPGQFNPEAISRLEQLENLVFPYWQTGSDESLPPGSATAQFELPFTEHLTLKTDPLCACIALRSITNRFEGDTLMESPTVRLLDANASAEPLRWAGFRPASYLDTDPVSLPCDIGRFIQYPGTCLYCYPNDCPDALPHTSLALDYSVCGIPHREVFELPLLHRAETIYLDL